MKLFTAHPASIGETYFQHMRFAMRFGTKMLIGGLACITHGIFPFLFQTTGSRIADNLQKNFADRNKEK
jgi:hypothetical protein